MRKAAHEGFSANVVKDYRTLQEQAARRLLTTLLEDPCERGWEHHIERWAEHHSSRILVIISVVLSSLAWTALGVIYGLTLEEAREREDIVHFVADFGRRTGTAALPGKFFIDVFPILQHLPHFVNPWKIAGEKSYQSDTRILGELVKEVRTRMVWHYPRVCCHVVLISAPALQASDGATRSFCADLIGLQAQDGSGLTDVQAAWLCGTV